MPFASATLIERQTPSIFASQVCGSGLVMAAWCHGVVARAREAMSHQAEGSRGWPGGHTRSSPGSRREAPLKVTASDLLQRISPRLADQRVLISGSARA